MNEDKFYGSGDDWDRVTTFGGVGSIWDKLTLLERNQEKILSRLDQLENVRDAKSEPEESLPIGHSLSKEQISDKLFFNKQREIKELKTKIADKHKLLLKMMDERDQYKNKLVLKEKVLEDVMDQRDRFSRENYQLRKTVDQHASTIALLKFDLEKARELTIQFEEREKTTNALNLQAEHFLSFIDKNHELKMKNEKLEKENYLQKGMITDYKDQIKQWESKESELETANKYWEERVEKLQKENADLRWRFDNPALVEQQAARECVEIINKIKNEPLTTVSTHREWMVAICEDIEKEIKKEFNLK